MRQWQFRSFIALIVFVVLAGCAGLAPDYPALLVSADRSDADRATDKRRNPVVVVANRPFDDPLPPEARNLDLVVFNFAYHDTANMNVDRSKMNRAIFDALKSGGTYIVADHSGLAGTGTSETKTLHRIEEAAVRREVESAGFRFVSEGGFLRNPQDTRTVPSGKNTVPNDEFVLKFVKP